MGAGQVLRVALWLLTLPVGVERGRITVRSEPGLETQGKRLAEAAERYLGPIEADLAGLPRIEHVEVRLVKHQAVLAEAAPSGRGAPAWAVGTAYPAEGVVVLAARGREGSLLDLEHTLAHELAHLALATGLGQRAIPRWLTEGFAYQHSSDASFSRARALIGAVFRGDMHPISDLDRHFPATEVDVGLAYAESYDFVAFLARRGASSREDDDGDREPFRRFLRRLGEGAPMDGASLEAFGRSLEQLESEWLATLQARYMWYPLGALGTLLWVLGGGLLFLGFRRRRRQMRLRLRQWEREEAVEDGHGPN